MSDSKAIPASPRRRRAQVRRVFRRIWRGIRRIARQISPDLAWYGLAVLGASAGFAIQLVSKPARDAGAGAVVLMIGIGLGFGRYVVARISQLEQTIGVSPVSFTHDSELSPLALKLYVEDVKAHHDRSKSLRDGTITMQNQDEMLEDLYLLSRAAEEEMWAVDFIALDQWFCNPRFRKYLDIQLERVAHDVSLRRVRFVRRTTLEESKQRALLREFDRRHQAAGAELRLCYFDNGQSIGDLIFFPSQGTLIVDPRSPCPGCLAGRLGDLGYIETAIVYLRDLDPVKRNIADWRRLWLEVDNRKWDEQVREELARHENDPAFDELDLSQELSTAGPLIRTA